MDSVRLFLILGIIGALGIGIFYFINFSSDGGLLGGLLGGLIPEGLIDGILPEGMEGRVGNIVNKGLGFAQDNAKKNLTSIDSLLKGDIIGAVSNIPNFSGVGFVSSFF